MISAGMVDIVFDREQADKSVTFICRAGRDYSELSQTQIDFINESAGSSCEPTVRDAFSNGMSQMQEDLQRRTYVDGWKMVTGWISEDCTLNMPAGLDAKSQIEWTAKCTSSYILDDTKSVIFAGEKTAPFPEMRQYIIDRALGIGIIGHERIQIPSNLKEFMDEIDADDALTPEEKKTLKEEAERLFREGVMWVPALDPDTGKGQRAHAAFPIGGQVVDNMKPKVEAFKAAPQGEAKDAIKNGMLYTVVTGTDKKPDYRLAVRDGNAEVAKVLGDTMEGVPPELRRLYAEALKKFVEKNGTDDPTLASALKAAVMKEFKTTNLKKIKPEDLAKYKVDDVLVDGPKAKEVKLGARKANAFPQRIADALGFHDQDEIVRFAAIDHWRRADELMSKMKERPSYIAVSDAIIDKLKDKKAAHMAALYIESINPNGSIKWGESTGAAARVEGGYEDKPLNPAMGDLNKGAVTYQRKFSDLVEKAVKDHPALTQDNIEHGISKFVANPILNDEDRYSVAKGRTFLSVTDVKFELDKDGNIIGAKYTFEDGTSDSSKLGMLEIPLGDGKYVGVKPYGYGAVGAVNGENAFRGELGIQPFFRKEDKNGKTALEIWLDVGWEMVRNRELYDNKNDSSVDSFSSMLLTEDGTNDLSRLSAASANGRFRLHDGENFDPFLSASAGLLKAGIGAPGAPSFLPDDMGPNFGLNAGGSRGVGGRLGLSAEILDAAIVPEIGFGLMTATGDVTVDGNNANGMKWLLSGILAVKIGQMGGFGNDALTVRAGGGYSRANDYSYLGDDNTQSASQWEVGGNIDSSVQLPVEGLRLLLGVGVKYASQQRQITDFGDDIIEELVPDLIVDSLQTDFDLSELIVGIGAGLEYTFTPNGYDLPVGLVLGYAHHNMSVDRIVASGTVTGDCDGDLAGLPCTDGADATYNLTLDPEQQGDLNNRIGQGPRQHAFKGQIYINPVKALKVYLNYQHFVVSDQEGSRSQDADAIEFGLGLLF